MKTTRNIKIAALNVAMHKPHSPARYLALLWDAKRLKRPVRMGNLHGALLGHLDGPKEYARGAYLTGEIFRFVRLDPSLPWFNTETSEAASTDDLGEVKIPKHLLPNMQTIEFVFLPDSHELWFISKDRKDTMGPTTAASFFQTLFDATSNKYNYPKIEVTAVPDADSIENMLSLHRIDRIQIELKRPNADDADESEIRWLDKLEAQNLRVIRTELIAANSEGMTPDAETKEFARVSARNGRVTVVGQDASGNKVEESTINTPLVQSATVDSLLETSQDVLVRIARGG